MIYYVKYSNDGENWQWTWCAEILEEPNEIKLVGRKKPSILIKKDKRRLYADKLNDLLLSKKEYLLLCYNVKTPSWYNQ